MEFSAYTNNLEDYKVFGILDDEYLPIEYIGLTQTYAQETCHPDTFSLCYKEYQDAYITIFKSILYINGEPDCIFEQTINHTPKQLIRLQEEKEHNDEIINGLVKTLKKRFYKNITIKRRFEEPYWTEDHKWEITRTVDAVLPINIDTSFRNGIAIIEKEIEDLNEYKPHPYGCFIFKNDTVFKHIEFVFNETTATFKNCGCCI